MVRRFGPLVLAAMLIGAVPVLAATVDITIPVETIVRGPGGSQHVLAVVDVPLESRGETCNVTAVAHNQGSQHPDSNLLISSATSVEILDVENTVYSSVSAGGSITLAETVRVTLTIGPDEVFSGGFDVEIDCPPFNPTMTTTTTTTTVTSLSAVDDVSTSSTEGATSSTSGASAGSSLPPVDTTGVLTSVLDTTLTAPGASAAAGTEALPFTGVPEGSISGLAFALVSLGGLLVLSTHRRGTGMIVARGWRSRIDFYDFKS